MRILYHHRTQGRGAEGVHIVSIVRALEGHGCEVLLLSPPGVDPLDEAGNAPVDKSGVELSGIRRLFKWISRHLPNLLFEFLEIGYNLAAWRRLREAMKKGPVDGVYERYAFFMVASAWLCRRRGVPLIVEANEVSGIPDRARPQVMKRLCDRFEHYYLSRATHIFTVSSYLRDMMVDKGIDPERITVTPNAIDPQQYRELPPRDPTLARDLGLEDRLVFGFVGWFDEWDRLDILIRAIGVLRDEGLPVAALLVGDGAVRPRLEAQVADLGLEDAVVFTGAVPRSEVRRYTQLLDVAVFSHSNDFGSPVVLFEFMALGKPVIAPRLPPILDVLEDGRDALLFDRLDETALQDRMRALAHDAPLRRRIGEAGRDKVFSRYTWPETARQILQRIHEARA